MSLRAGSIKHNSSDDEKGQPQYDNGVVDGGYGDVEDPLEDHEVFKKTHDGVNFRTVGWPRASVIFLKSTCVPRFLDLFLLTVCSVIFATGVLSIPTAMYSLGAVGGALSVIAWGALNTYEAVVQGNFRNAHPGCHSIADMAEVLGGVVLKE